MAIDWRIAETMAESMADLINTALSAGDDPPLLRIYTGSQPDGPASEATGTLLAEIELNDPAFNSANGVLTIDTTDGLVTEAIADGTAGWGRFCDSDGNGVVDGNVGTSSSAILINLLTIATGDPVNIL